MAGRARGTVAVFASSCFASLVLASFFFASPLFAQCPDGSPPPCRSTSSLAGRVPSLALNDNTWLILPFENTARTADAELIRQVSVSQLYGEMSRWSGIRVVSDDRVADLMHTLPEAKRDRPGLEDAIALARRVGAGRIVLGSYVALGGRANITAKVYETRTQRELRVARGSLAGIQSAAALDSLTASFNRLARGILDVPEGAGGGTSVGIGTASMEAYRAYVAGMDAFNHLRIDSARVLLERAVQLDSNYALAHLALVEVTNDTTLSRPHMDAAIRLASSLPPRGRLLVDQAAAERRRDRDGMCRAANALVASDSSDAAGWVALTTCYLDPEVVVENGRPRIKGDLNRGLHAAQRAFALDPNGVESSGALIQAMQIGSYMTCVGPVAGLCPLDRYYRVSILAPADSYVVAINLWRDVKARPPDLEPAAVAAQMERYRRLVQFCERLAQSADSWIAHYVTAQVALAANDLQTADAHLGRGNLGRTDTTGSIRVVYFQSRLTVALGLERAEQLNLWADSLFARPVGGVLRSMMGRLSEVADTTPSLRQNTVWREILVGVLPAGFDTLDQRIRSRLTEPQLGDYVQLTQLAAFHLGYRGPALDTAAQHPLKRYQAFAALGNTVRARAALAEFDRELAARDDRTPDDGGSLFSAESHLELGDSSGAWERMQEFMRRWPTSLPGATILEDRFWQSTTPRLWGRAWLLAGDLAMARHQVAPARRAYRMVIALWERGDPVVQPFVTRARTALAQLGS